MVVVGFLSWWYGSGLKRHIALAWRRIALTYEYFSVGQLIQTWFAPFRQISAGAVSGSFSVQWHAFTDRTISRFVGGVVRTAMIVAGLISIVFMVGAGIITVIGWLLIPSVPIVGLTLSLMGWIPW